MRWSSCSIGSWISTSSFSQETGTFIPIPPAGAPRGIPSELLQEAQVVGPEAPNIVDLVLQHGDALRPHAEGEPAELLRVVPSVYQHHRMHHPAPQDLQPAGALAHRAALPSAHEALDVHLRRGLGEGEVGRPETSLDRLSEETAGGGGGGGPPGRGGGGAVPPPPPPPPS